MSHEELPEGLETDCILDDDPRARTFSASAVPETFNEWVDQIVSEIAFPVDRLGLTFLPQTPSGFHFRNKEVRIDPEQMNSLRGARVLVHEVGHAVEMGYMNNPERKRLMDEWGVPDDGRGILTQWRNSTGAHRTRPRETYATLFAYVTAPQYAFSMSVNDYLTTEAIEPAAEVTSDIQNTRLIEKPEPDPVPAAFSDIADHPHREAIEDLARLGVINGYSDGTFRPQENVTRAQAAVMFKRLLDHLGGNA